jgi:hypothetical protein
MSSCVTSAADDLQRLETVAEELLFQKLSL